MTAIRNVQTQAMALEARGFDTRGERTFYTRQSFHASDWAATIAGVAVIAGAIGLRVAGYGVI